jgi:flavin-dependent dehydrogenase
MAAALLARSGARVRVLERDQFPRQKLCGDTLNPGALRILSAHFALDQLLHASLPLDGMVLTGPGGVSVRGEYGERRVGRAIRRQDFDAWLIEQARTAGACVEYGVTVRDTLRTCHGVVCGVTAGERASSREYRARIVIAADGRASRLARASGLAQHPRRPRRWAIGGYFDGVSGLGPRGEMHVRGGHYIGVAPVPGGSANTCLVIPYHGGGRSWTDPAEMLRAAIAADSQLAPRFARARLVAAPTVLGPMAVDAPRAGAAGMLLAGDAAGFIDPITGDGLRLALDSAMLTADVAGRVLAGELDVSTAPQRLTRARAEMFAAKWRFNRGLRLLVASPRAIGAAAVAARVAPSAFAAIIRYAGDC